MNDLQLAASKCHLDDFLKPYTLESSTSSLCTLYLHRMQVQLAVHACSKQGHQSNVTTADT